MSQAIEVSYGSQTLTLEVGENTAAAARSAELAANYATIVTETGNTIFTPATRSVNSDDTDFQTYYDRFYGLEIVVPKSLNGAAQPRLFVTNIGLKAGTAGGVTAKIGVTFSQLKTDGTFEDVAECYSFQPSYSYHDGTTFVSGVLVGLGDYAATISGKVRMERTTAWNYFYAGGNATNQASRTYNDTTPATSSLEVDPAFVVIRDAVASQASVFTPTAFAQNTDVAFRTYLEPAIFDMKIELAAGLDAFPYKRLYVTGTANKSTLTFPSLEISYLDEDDEFVVVADGITPSVSTNSNHYDGLTQFVSYELSPAAGYEYLISGTFKWLRSSWDYFYAGGNAATQAARAYTNDTPALGALELSQDVITYVGDAQILPDAPTYPRIMERFPNFTEHYLKGDQDVTLLAYGDSIMTANNYASDRADASTRPPLCHEFTMFSYVEEKLRWRGQKYARFDVASTFTETASTATTKEYDAAWDWQVSEPLTPTLATNYKPAITRVLEGTDCSVEYEFPADMRRCDFIYRTDYLCAATTTVDVAEGDGVVEVYDEGTSSWVEANGYSFSAQETDTIISAEFTNYLGVTYTKPLRKSVYQRRLKMRSLSDLTAKTITIANSGSGRLNYWGIEYSPRPVMFRAINAARGGHNLSRLLPFQAWDVDSFEPDLIWLNNPIINEGATSTTGMVASNTPTAFATRFTSFISNLEGKAYSPEVLTSTMFVGSQAQLVDQTTGEYNVGTLVGGGTITTFDYIGHLDRALETADVPHVNMFYEFLHIAEALAEAAGTGNIWTAAMVGSGVSGSTLLSDGVHPNDYGNLVAKTLVLPVFLALY